jgi:putative transposase
VDLTVAIVAINQMRKRKKKGRWALGYIINRINKSPKRIMKTYKHRVEIESSYRIQNYVRAKATTRNPAIRYLYALVSFLLKNVWVAIQLHFCSETKQGPKVI